MNKYDAVMIGAGPAGISAALYTVRAGLSTLAVGTGASSLKKASKIENYYGFENPLSGQELLSVGIAQAKRLGVEILESEVTAVEFGDGFSVVTSSRNICAKAVLIATGQAPNRPRIPGIEEFEGRGVSYCTTCDGFFFRGKKVGVLGSGNYAVQEALELLPFTKDVTIYTDGREPVFSGEYQKKAAEFQIDSSQITGLFGDRSLEEIRFAESARKLDGLFVASGSASSIDFAVKLGVAVRGQAIVTDQEQKTNLEGIFAAGDCTGGFKQISVAVGQGAAAGKSMIEYIRKH